jgi:hypothetical protein
MGRPLNKKYFGNRNIGSTSTAADDGIGGQAVASIAVTGSFSGKTTGTPYAVTITTPDLPDGVQATATITFSSATAGTVTVTEGGSGYTGVPSASCTLGGGTGDPTLTVTLSVDTGAVGSATNDENAIITRVYIPGGTGFSTGDIIKQVSTRRFKVKNVEGTGICELVTDGLANAAGEMSIKATDSEGKNYLVAKITSRKVVLVPAAAGGTAGTQFASGTTAKWTFGSAVLNDTVTIQNG